MSQTRGMVGVNFRNSGATIPAYRIVGVSGDDTVSLWATATTQMVGIAQEQADSLASVFVAIYGSAKGEAGASVSAGSVLSGLTATGQVIASTALQDTVTTDIPFMIGLALQSGSTNAAIEVLVRPTHWRILNA